MKNKISILLVTLIFLSFSLFAQETTGELQGNILIPDGTYLPGVIINVKGTNLVGEKNIISDENGSYKIPMLPPGKYDLTFKLEGFKTAVLKGVELQVGKVLKMDIMMIPGKLEVIEKTKSTNSIIDVRQSSSITNVNRKKILRLPRGRNIGDYQGDCIDGVTYEKGKLGRGYSFNGASIAENTFFIDGMNVRDLMNGLNLQRVDVDCIEELQAKSSGYAAEYGGSMGGVISVITRSGGNKFQGDLSFYYSADWLKGKEKAPLVIDPYNVNNAIYDKEQSKDKFNTIEPAISLSGYFIKNKAWFFLNFSPSFTKITRTGRFVYKPEHNGEKFKSETTRYKGVAKLTFALSNSISLTLGGTLDWQKSLKLLPYSDGTEYYNPNSWNNFGYKLPKMTLSGSLNWTLPNDLFLNFSGGYFRSNAFDINKDSKNPPVRIWFANSNAQLTPGKGLVRDRNFNNISASESEVNKKYLQERIKAKGDLTYYLNALGDHVLKAGLELNKQKFSVNRLITGNETWAFFWKDLKNDLFVNYYTDFGGKAYPTTYGYVTSVKRKEFGTAENNIISLYFQDSWTLKKNLTLNIGFRMEQEKMPIMDKAKYDYAFKFNFFDKLAPRIGFAWDIKGNGKHKLFGSYGIYYDTLTFDMVYQALGGAIWWENTYDITTLDWKKYLNVRSPSWSADDPRPFNDPILGGKRFDSVNNREATNPDTEIQPDIKAFSKMEASLGYATMVSDNLSLTVTWLYNKVLNAIEDIGVMKEGGTSYYLGNPGSDWIRDKFDPQNNYDVPENYEAPKARRKYKALQFILEKSLANNWLGGISLNLSKLSGNFSGLASSDEFHKTAPMGERFFDSWYLHLKEDLTDSDGRLPTDRPLHIILYGAYTFDSNLTIGFSSFLKSGTPVTRYVDINNIRVGYAPQGRGNLGRTPTVWQIDLFLEKVFSLSDRVKFGITADISNLTNNRISLNKWSNENYEKIAVSNDELKLGYSIDDVMERMGTLRDPRYLKKYNFQAPISLLLGVNLKF